jgi:hypothetical protein
MFQPKGHTSLAAVQLTSVVGPIGLPIQEAAYLPVVTADGVPFNAQHDYVIRMTKQQLPPAHAFWSLTLYDTEHGFFIPNDQGKYSVGENAGFELNQDGGIDIYVAAEQPAGVPAANWLPINRSISSSACTTLCWKKLPAGNRSHCNDSTKQLSISSIRVLIASSRRPLGDGLDVMRPLKEFRHDTDQKQFAGRRAGQHNGNCQHDGNRQRNGNAGKLYPGGIRQHATRQSSANRWCRRARSSASTRPSGQTNGGADEP